jgi:hypothetical protein
MSRTFDNEKKPSQSTASVQPKATYLQTRGFASLQTDLDEDAPVRPSGYSENFLEKIINEGSTASSNTPVQAKPMNRLMKPLQTKRIAIQAKLNIGEPNDKYEQEADATAAKVVQKINSPIQNQSVQKQESLQTKSLVQRRENVGGGEASTDLESSIQSARGSGQPLDANLQAKMGQAMGVDFNGVRVHTDSKAAQLSQSVQAKAFTTGNDIFFNNGEYNPKSLGGQELLAHELTHTIQQGASGTKPIQAKFSSSPNNILIQRKWMGLGNELSSLKSKARVGIGGGQVKAGKTVDEVTNPVNPISKRLKEVLKTLGRYNLLQALRDYNSLIAGNQNVIDFPLVDNFLNSHAGNLNFERDKLPPGIKSGIPKADDKNKRDVRTAVLTSRMQGFVDTGKNILKGALDVYNQQHARQNVPNPIVTAPQTDDEIFESHGVDSTDFKSQNLESSKVLGSGSVNTVYKNKYKNDDKDYVFKPDDEVNTAYDLDAGTQVGIPEVNPEFAKRAVAASRIDQLLDANMLTNTDFAVQDGQFGTVSAFADGDPMEKIDPKLRDGIKSDPKFQLALSKLQLLDIICGQVDRHIGNYHIELDTNGNFVKLTGIDNDMAFGSEHTDIDQKIGKGRNVYDSATRDKGGSNPNLGRMGGSKHLEQIGRIDPQFAEVIIKLNVQLISDALKDLLQPKEIQATIMRVNQLKQFLKDAQRQELATTLKSLNSKDPLKGKKKPKKGEKQTIENANNLVDQYRTLKKAGNWEEAYEILLDLRKRLNRFESSDLDDKVKTAAIGDMKNVDNLTKEMLFVSQKMNIPDSVDVVLDVKTSDSADKAKVLWAYLNKPSKAGGNVDNEKLILNRIWKYGDATIRQNLISALGTRQDQLKMSTFAYILEAIDPDHRMPLNGKATEWYGQNSTENFFTWVNSNSPTKDKVAYMDNNARTSANVKFEGGRLFQMGKPINTGSEDWIVVQSSDNQFYSKPKVRASGGKDGTQHSSFLEGLPVQSAGMLNVKSGSLTKVKNHSGHYAPQTRHLLKMYLTLEAFGVNMSNVEVEDSDKLKGVNGSLGAGKFKGQEFVGEAKKVI